MMLIDFGSWSPRGSYAALQLQVSHDGHDYYTITIT
jgi:hypothetical protein